MTESEALQQYDRYLWKQVHAFHRAVRTNAISLDDLIQEARLAFIQHIRTHDESEWAACTLTIKHALFDFAKACYPVTMGRKKFLEVLRGEAAAIFIIPLEEYMELYGIRHSVENDPTALDVKRFIDSLRPLEQQTVILRLEGYTYGEIGKRLGTSEGNVFHRITKIRQRWST